MPKGAKSQKTKRALADALRDLTAEKPLRKVSVREVAQRAGVDRQTFYYHFGTMDDLVVYLCKECVAAAPQDVAACSGADQLFDLLISQVEQNRDVLAVLLKGAGRNALREVFHDDTKQALMHQARLLLGTARLACGHRKGLEFAVEYCLLASASMLVEWLDGTIDGSASELSQLLAGSFEQQIHGFAMNARE